MAHHLTFDKSPGMFTINGEVTANPLGWRISQGALPYHENFRAFGYNANIGATLEDVASISANIPFPTSAVTMQIISSSANDVGILRVSGVATGGSTTTLIDSGKTFQTSNVAVGDAVLNDIDQVCYYVKSVDSQTQLTFEPVADTVMTGKTYRIVGSANTGVPVVELHGLDANFLEQSEFVITNGLTAVNTTKQYIRTNILHSMMSGSSGVAVGTIQLRNVGGGIVYNQIDAGLNMAMQACVTVPANKTMYITSWNAGSSGAKSVQVFLRATTDYHNRSWLRNVFHIQDVMVLLSSDSSHIFSLPLKFPSKSDVKISAASLAGGAGGAAEVGCGFEYWLELNE